MSRRRKPSAQTLYIWEQTVRIFQAYSGAIEHRDRPGARAIWQKLWDENAVGGKLDTLAIEAAGDLLTWGWRFAMEDGRYEAATELMSLYFQHPDIQQDHEGLLTLNRCSLATSILFSGQIATAVEMFRSLLECERKNMARMALLHMQGDLEHYLSERDSCEPASPVLAELVEEVVNRLRRRVPKKKRLPDKATNADLLRLLESTYPPEGREALRREREQQSDPAAE